MVFINSKNSEYSYYLFSGAILWMKAMLSPPLPSPNGHTKSVFYDLDGTPGIEPVTSRTKSFIFIIIINVIINKRKLRIRRFYDFAIDEQF